ncbi:hypothetical protein [Companilactobacillus formosensis]|uniref:hypothetical protein n=1 Tax=Companilactobacillus formosensis TaxID=1617889 RepID=UPI000E6567B3|nr:hypothetical protein [Companilactobacillus formosensis]
MKERVKVGFGKSIIKINDEDLPIREFASKLTDLYTRVIFLKNDSSKLKILVSIEMTSLTQRDINKFKELICNKYNTDSKNIWITVTHTFSAPHLKHDISNTDDKKVYKFWIEKIETSLKESCNEAFLDLQFVKISYNSIYCPLNINRNIETAQGWWLGRNFKAFSNHMLKTIVFEKANGTKNLIFNFDMQPSVFDHISNDNNQRVIASDIFGIAATHVENRYSNIVFPLIGAAGDQRPLIVADNSHSYAVNRQLLFEQSSLLKDAILQSVNSNKTTELDRFDIFEVNLILSGQIQQHGTFDLSPTHDYKFLKSETPIKANIFALQLNDILVLGTQPELNSSFANKFIKRINCSKVIMSTLVNGGLKYLPEKKDFERITYEAMNTSLGQNADEEFLRVSEEINIKLKEGKSC